MMYRLAILIVPLAAFLVVPSVLHAESEADATPPSREGLEFFEKRIRPVLARSCYPCHSGNPTKAKGKLVLDSHDGFRQGGRSGAVVVPGNVDDSLLIEALRHEGLEMPPKEKLPDETIADFVQWVEMGAPFPRAAKAARPKDKIDYAAAREFWSFQPPKASSPPAVDDAGWARSDIDRFVLAGLESAGLKPVADAAPAALLRRVTFDLTGLPPTPEAIAEYLADPSDGAFISVVDRLLASPQFGERWGRHWLDVARFGESTGKERNLPFRYAWRYRDYVIAAFNADKPYDRFVLEQLAGDLLPAEDDAQRNAQLIATGFLAIGPKGVNEKNAEQYQMDVIDDQIDAATRGILGLTVACARCHDHKSDPIASADYYALAGIFHSTETYCGVNQGKTSIGDRFLLPLAGSGPPAEGSAVAQAEQSRLEEIARVETQLKELRTKQKELARQVKRARQMADATLGDASEESRQDEQPAAGAEPVAEAAAAEENDVEMAGADEEPGAADMADAQASAKAKKKKPATPAKKKPNQQALDRKLKQVKKQVQKLENSLAELKNAPVGDLAMGVRDSESPDDCRLLVRGDLKDKGPGIPRGGLALFTAGALPQIDAKHSGRLELARWMTGRDNPLVARVQVNRVWQHLLGRGLVETSDNFGMQGEAPSHPALLDALAVQFMDDGWSVKRLIRSIVLSRVYRLASAHDPRADEIDPSNRLLWRHARRRLDAEEVRDALLAIGGTLDLSPTGGSPVLQLGNDELGKGKRAAELSKLPPFRSVYLPMVRGQVPDALHLFDMADPSLIVARREVTNVATQSLFLMNNPLVLEQSDRLAQRLLAEQPLDEAGRIDRACLIALGRPGTTDEKARISRFLSDYRQSLDRGRYTGDASLAAWSGVCQTLIATAEFRYLY